MCKFDIMAFVSYSSIFTRECERLEERVQVEKCEIIDLQNRLKKLKNQP